MTDESRFDWQRHKVVAVPYREDDPERGQHFHVDMSEMVNEIKDYLTANSIPTSGEIVQIDHSVPAQYEQQMGFLIKTLQSYESRLIAVEARVEDVEARPHLSEATVRELMTGINTRFHDKIKELVAQSNGDMRSQITALKSTAVTRQTEPASDQLAKLSRLIDSVGDYVKTFERTVEDQNSALEEKYAAIAAHLQQTNGDVMKVKTMVYRLAAAVREPEDA